MFYRPLPIIILAFLHLIEPINKGIFYCWYYGLSITEYFLFINQSMGFMEQLKYFLLFPVAGLLIYFVKRWAYYLFLVIQGIVFYDNFDFIVGLFEHGQYLLFSFLVFFAFLNLFVVSYFVFSETRRVYHQKSMRWWESAPRFHLRMPCLLEIYGQPKDSENSNQSHVRKEICQLFNISTSGVGLYFQDQYELVVGDIVNLKIDFFNIKLSLNGRVVHKFFNNNLRIFGVEFINRTMGDFLSLHRLNSLMEQLDIPKIPKRRDYIKELKLIWENFIHRFAKKEKT